MSDGRWNLTKEEQKLDMDALADELAPLRARGRHITRRTCIPGWNFKTDIFFTLS